MITTQEILFQKLCYLLHRALVEIRNLSLTKDHTRIHELADTFEMLPTLMANWDDGHVELIRKVLLQNQSISKDSGADYIAILEMDDDHFLQLYDSQGGYR